MPDPRLEQMQSIFKIIQDSVTKEEFIAGLEALRTRIDAVEGTSEAEFKLMHGAIDALSGKLKADNSEDMQTVRDACGAMMRQCDAQLASMMKTVATLQDGEDGEDADPADIVPLVLAAMPDDIDDTGDQIIDKINAADQQISKDAIEGFAELEKAVAEKTGNTTRIGWGAHPITVYHNSTVIDKNTRVINFASNLTVSRNASGVVTVSATNGGVTELVATGTINSANMTFTFVSKPSYIYIDGAKYKENAGWTWNNGTLTAIVTKAPDFSIWGEA